MHSLRLTLFLIFLTVALRGSNYLKNSSFITRDNGLSQNYISAITQDSRGFMWFGTMDGLNRFDGYSFKVYYNKYDDSTSISCNQIRNLAIGKDGTVWVGTYNGLNRFDPFKNQFKRYPILSPTSRKNEINCLRVDHLGIIWFNYADDDYLIGLDPSNNKVECYKLPVNNAPVLSIPEPKTKISLSIASLFINKADQIWVGTSTGSLLLFDIQSKKFTHNKLIDSDCRIYAIEELNSDSLCLGTYNKGFCFYNIKEEKRGPIYHFSHPDKKEINFLWTIEKGPDGNLWLGTWDSGFYQLDVKKKRLNQVFLSNPGKSGTSDKSVCSIFFDKSGLLWCGTNGYGLYNLNPFFTHFNTINQEIRGILNHTSFPDIDLYDYISSKNNSLSFQSVRSVFANDKYIWVGGYSGLNKIDRKTGQIKIIDDKLVPYVMKPDISDPDNILYIGSEIDGAALYRLDLKTDRLTRLGYDGNSIYSIFPCKDFLWLGGRDGLIKYNLKTGKDELFTNGNNNADNKKTGMIKAMSMDQNNNLWVGIQGVGLAKADERNNKFIIWKNNPNEENSLSNDIIIYLNCDEHNNLWVGTNGGGLNKFDIKNEIFTRYTTRNGLSNDVVYCALPDSEGNLWLSTNNGICRFNPIDQRVRTYNIDDGLQNNEFNTSAYFKDKSGNLFFGGVNGLTYFFPENISESHFKPDIVLTSVKKYNEEVLYDKQLTDLDELTFAYNDKVFSLTFSALSYDQSNRNKYKYRILGLNDQWIMLDTKREIIFNGLPSGDYALEVLASNRDGYWADKPLSLRIHITYPFWETWWFYGTCLFIIVVLVWAYIRYHNASIVKFNTLLKEQVNSKTKEILEQNQEIEARKAQVEMTNIALEHSNATKDKFFGIIAHDLRAPFNSILGLSTILNEEYDSFTDVERHEYIADIMNASGSAFKLLENLLEWARFQSGKIIYNPELVDLYDISNETSELFYSTLSVKKIKLESGIRPDTTVFVDRNMVRTIVRNLVSNAIKFTYTNGNINISAREIGNKIELSVVDDGIGMAPLVVDKLFNLDSKNVIKGTNNETGTGLGLILCKDFVERNSGSIRVESSPGKGSTFSVILPKSKNTYNQIN